MKTFHDTFAQRVCVVTGGASGIGRALCRELAAAGAWVTVADMDAAAAERLAAELGTQGRRVQAAGLDVCDITAVNQLVDRVMAQHGRLDYMFNNAGISTFGEACDVPLSRWHAVMNVNFWGVLHGCRAAARVMVAQGHGHIVNTGSALATMVHPMLAPYAAAKHAMLAAAETLRVELYEHGVHVTTVCPGWVNTPLIDPTTPSTGAFGLDPAQLQRTIATYPLLSEYDCACTILRHVQRRSGVAIFPSYARWSALLVRAWPALLFRIMRKTARTLRHGRYSGEQVAPPAGVEPAAYRD